MPVKYPKCFNRRTDCTARIKGDKCAVLSSTEPDKIDCSFYRSKRAMTVNDLEEYFSKYLKQEAKYV